MEFFLITSYHAGKVCINGKAIGGGRATNKWKDHDPKINLKNIKNKKKE